MKNLLFALLFLLIIAKPPDIAFAVDAPVLLTHTLTSSVAETTRLMLYFNLHLENPGEEALTDLQLSFIPLPPFLERDASIRVPALGAREATDLAIALTVAPQQRAAAAAYGPLSFSGKCVDARGRSVEFAATSHPGAPGGSK